MDGWQIETGNRPGSGAPRRPLGVHMAEWLVVLVILTSFYVRSEPGQDKPSPYDLMMAGTVGLCFLLGLRFPRRIGWPAALWGLVVAGFGIGAMDALYMERVRPAMMTTIYLVGAFLFFTSWIYADPMRRLTQIFWAYTASATLAAAFGIAGYFGLVPGAEIFTQYGRAMGTFNDPNVFGPFLVAPILFLGWRLSTAQSLRSFWIAFPFGLLVLALLLSFSRGAWGNLLFSGLVFFGLTLATSKSYLQTMRLVGFGALTVVVMMGVVGFALSSPKVANLFEERASLVQSYDTDPEYGRFESQSRAFAMALEKPLGLGPAQWAMINRLDTHNVYLNVLVAGGFLSGFAFIALMLVTLVRGWRAIGRESPAQGLLIVVYAAFAGHIAEAFIIDIDNWRHFYLIVGTLWGLVLAVEERGEVRRTVPGAASRPPQGIGRAPVSGFQA
ncbi:MAG: O-antigen ligase family protein [Parvibaculum sp.]|uniref:O-antigen ligase family protein n=1 Tax=Parvibaculum sp. TaxID=2024848 RepID=UPI002ABA0555|nr:O-antigen ligase family protein [Parvibaculum sp.]MDZ4382735.1 O-antigen ligase family protein [Parvibaculum sp.]